MDDSPLQVVIEIQPSDFIDANAFLASITLPARMAPEQRRGQIALNYVLDLVKEGIEEVLRTRAEIEARFPLLRDEGDSPEGGVTAPVSPPPGMPPEALRLHPAAENPSGGVAVPPVQIAGHAPVDVSP